MLDDLASNFGSPSNGDNTIDMFIVSGDFVVHGMSAYNEYESFWP
jgi:hypothetical protein